MSVSRRRVRAIYRKELREYRRNRTIVTGMAILPLLFLVQPLDDLCVGMSCGHEARASMIIV